MNPSSSHSHRSVIVTGATGVIGRWVPELLLKRGFTVHLLGRRISERCATQSRFRGCTFHDIDLLDPSRLSEQLRQVNASHLLHLAWHQMDPATIYVSNENLSWVGASVDLIQAFAEAGGQRVVVAGTCAEYEWGKGLLDEDVSPRKPSNAYGIAKAALREALNPKTSTLGLSLAWPHIFSCFGPGERPRRLVPDAISTLVANQLFHCTEGNQKRDYLYAEDIAAALVEILQSKTEGMLNIATGHGITVRELVDVIAQSVGRPDLVRYGARPRLPIDPEYIVGSTRRLTQEVGFKPRFTLKEGIDRTILYFRNQLE